MALTIVGNGCLVLAGLLFLYPILPMLQETPRGHDGATGRMMGLTLLLLPLWLLLSVALAVATARGSFGWVPVGRALQYPLVLSACAAMAVVTWFSGSLRGEPADQVPWAARAVIGWAVYVLPLVIVGTGVFLVNPSLGELVPPLLVRLPVALSGGLSILVCAGLLSEGLSAWSSRTAARVEHEISRQNERDERYLAEVRGMDPERDFPQLLNHTSEFESPAIRALALEKALAHPHFTEALAEALRSGWSDYALRYVESNDPPDAQALAEPVRQALLREADWVRDMMRREHTLRDDDFDYRAVRLVKVVDRFRKDGADHAAAVRAYRQAFDEPRDGAKGHNRVNPTCRRMLDEWLAAESRNR